MIDKQRDADNVYFLNAVTESDLMALAEKDGDTTTAQPVEPEPQPTVTPQPEEPVTEEPKEPEQPQTQGTSPLMMVLIGVAVLAVGGLATTSRFINQSMNWTTLPILMNLSLRGRRKKPSGRKIWNPPN